MWLKIRPQQSLLFIVFLPDSQLLFSFFFTHTACLKQQFLKDFRKFFKGKKWPQVISVIPSSMNFYGTLLLTEGLQSCFCCSPTSAPRTVADWPHWTRVGIKEKCSLSSFLKYNKHQPISLLIIIGKNSIWILPLMHWRGGIFINNFFQSLYHQEIYLKV